MVSIKLQNVLDLWDEKVLERINQSGQGKKKVVLLGYSSEAGARACPGGRYGSDKGADAFRDGMKVCGLTSDPCEAVGTETSANLADNVEIIDCGNIEIIQEGPTPAQYASCPGDELMMQSTKVEDSMNKENKALAMQANDKLEEVLN